MRKEINLEEILSFGETYEKDCNTVSVNDALIAMKEACRKTLELAAENARISRKDYSEASLEECLNGYDVFFNEEDDCPSFIDIIDRQSIIDTINQIK